MPNPLTGLRDVIAAQLLGADWQTKEHAPLQVDEDAEMVKALAERARMRVGREIYPPKAGDASPAVMRATQSLKKDYPADMAGVEVVENPMRDREAFSNRLGATDSAAMQAMDPEKHYANPDYKQIRLNPIMGASAPQGHIESTLAHELEHVRQNRDMDPIEQLAQQAIPYGKRPLERAAFKAGDNYLTKKGRPTSLTPLEETMITNLGKIY